MTCNCDNDGSNEYIIELNQQGAPGVRGEKGEQGYSPTVSYISDGSGLVINIVNEQDTISTPVIPLKSYVDTVSDTKMNTDGSNAASSVKFNNITFSYTGATQQTIRTISNQELLIAGQGLYLQGHASQAQGYPHSIAIAPRGTSIRIGNTSRHTIVVDNDGAFYDSNEIATVDQIPSITGKLNTDGSNATNTFTVNGVELAGNYVYMNSVSSGGISVTQSNSDIFAKLQVDSSIAQLRMPGLYLNSGATGNIALNTTRDIIINSSNASDKMYYHGTSANNEVAIKGDIPGIMVGATSDSNGVAGLVPAPTPDDRGRYLNGNGTWTKVSGSSIANPINLITDSNDMFWMGIATNTTPHQIYGGCQNSNGVQYLKYIYDSSNPIALTDDPLGHGTSKIELNYNTNTMGLDSSNKLTVKEMVGCDSITGGSAGLVPAPSAGDEDKFLKADGTWDTVGGGGSSYTAGTGIDITNDTISVDSTILTTNTVQTVTEEKTFSADIHLNGAGIKLDTTNAYIRGKVSGNTYRNIVARSISGSEITIGNKSDVLKLAGSLLHPKYNGVDVALLADVPTITLREWS